MDPKVFLPKPSASSSSEMTHHSFFIASVLAFLLYGSNVTP